MGKEGAHVQHARRRVGRPRARSLARPVTVLGEGGREGGGLEWRGEIETEWAKEGRSDGQPNSHCTVAVAACSTSAPLSGGAVAPAFGNDCDCSRFLIRNPMVLASERRKGIIGSKCGLAVLKGPYPAPYYSVLFY